MASLRDVVSVYDELAIEYFDTGRSFSPYSRPSLLKPKKNTVYFKKDSHTLHVIQELIKAFEKYCVRVSDFEKNNGRNEHEFFSMSQKSNSKSILDGKKQVVQKHKEWQRKAKEQNYQEAKAAIVFLKNVIDLLEKLVQSGKKCEISDALDKLTKMQTGNAAMDNENKRLLELYQQKIKEDIEEMTREQSKAVNDSIISVRKKDKFYQWKAKRGNLFLPTDYKDLGYHSSCGHTFKEIFDLLRSEAKKIDIDVQFYDDKKSSGLRQKTYLERTSKLDKDFEKIESSKSSLEGYGKYDKLFLSDKDKELFRKTTYDALSQIDKLIKLHKELKKSKSKKDSIMIKYDALKQRLAALVESLSVIKASEMPKTYHMLETERVKCLNEMEKYKSVVSDIESLIARFESEIIKFDDLMRTYNGLIGKANDQDLNRQDSIVNEREKFMTQSMPNRGASNQADIDKVKWEVLRAMSLEGYKPNISYPNDIEHTNADYRGEFNDVFRSRLISRLDELGIDYEGADLSNPYDTAPIEEAHKASRK